MTPHDNHFPIDLVHLIGYLLFSITIIVILWLTYKHGGSIVEGLKGSNKRWDSPEILILFSLPVFICMLLADIFLGFHASEWAWISVDAALGVGSGTRAWMEKPPKYKPPTSSGGGKKESEAIR